MYYVCMSQPFPFQHRSLAGAGVTVSPVAPLAACTGFVATTSQCTLQAANYNGGVAITVTCTGSTWGAAVLSADATCDQFESGSGCQVRGLNSVPNPRQIRCSGPASTDCTESTCCVATCNNPLFTGCGGTGYQAKVGWENIECMDANPTNCNVSTCCDATVCGNYVCRAGQSSRPNPPICVFRPVETSSVPLGTGRMDRLEPV